MFFFVSVAFCFVLFNFMSPLRVAMGVVSVSLLYSFMLIKNFSALLGVILMLLYTGGILVVFLYMTAISYNPVLPRNIKVTFIAGMLLSVSMLGWEGRCVALEFGGSMYDLVNISLFGVIMYVCIWVINKLLLGVSVSLRVAEVSLCY